MNLSHATPQNPDIGATDDTQDRSQTGSILSVRVERVERESSHRERCKALIIGTEKENVRILEMLAQWGATIYDVAATLCLPDDHHSALSSDDRMQLKALIDDDNIDAIVLGWPGKSNHWILRELLPALAKGIALISSEDLYERVTGRVSLDRLAEAIHAAVTREDSPYKIYARVKRGLDVALGLAGLAVLTVLFVPLVIAIKLTCNGTLFIRQERIGRYGRPFTVRNFRTHASSTAERDISASQSARASLVARYIQRLALDKLPRCVNILKGDMSLIGPRSEPADTYTHLVDEFPIYDALLFVRPGFTGWAQTHIEARMFHDPLRRLEHDLFYVKNMSLLLDMKVLQRTLALLLGRRPS